MMKWITWVRMHKLTRISLVVAMSTMLALSVSGFGESGQAEADITVPQAEYGFAGGSDMLWLSQADLNRELDGAATTKASWLRVVVDWNSVEPSNNSYNWATPDRMINSARQHGFKVLATVVSSPAWARPSGSFFTAPPTNNADLADFLRAFVARYSNRVSTYQIWNEVNLPIFFGGSVDAARYTALLKAGYSAIKSAQPGATVLSAGLARSVGPFSPLTYYTAMYNNGVKGYFDAAAMHPYVFPGGASTNPENAISDVVGLRELMVARGDSAKKIWFTEIGAPTASGSPDGVTEQEQAKQITDMLWFAATSGYNGPTLIYTIRDSGTSTTDREQSFGAVFTYDWRLKYTASVLAG
ncbi:hypothetical protein ACWDPV_01625 [Gordonia sp. NPDC003504]